MQKHIRSVGPRRRLVLYVIFGLVAGPDGVEIAWPGGAHTQIKPPAIDRLMTVVEPSSFH